MKYGKRGKKYKCIPCTDDEDIVRDLFNKEEEGWSEWGAWSLCSVSCGTGLKTRRRLCHSADRSMCEGEKVERDPCSLTAYCPGEIYRCFQSCSLIFYVTCWKQLDRLLGVSSHFIKKHSETWKIRLQRQC